MQEQNQSGFMGFVESVGGADTFVWIVMFSLLIVVAVGLALFGPKENG